MKYLLAALFSLLFIACASRQPLSEKNEIYDLVHIPQNVEYYTQKIDSNETFYEIQKEYEKFYFGMWNTDTPKSTLEDIKESFKFYNVSNSYGENLQALEQDFFDAMYENSNFDSFATLNKKAITLQYSNIRVFPTIRPLLKNPSLAGEGFPFDYLQNSSIHANEPILVSHYSKDKKWVYVFSNFAGGWLRTDEIVFLQTKDTNALQNTEHVFITKENIPIVSTSGDFLFTSKVGMILSLIGEDKTSYTILAVSSCANSKPIFLQSKISKKIAHKGVLNLAGNNLNTIITEISTTNYGWGGIYEQRDCSSTMRDLFAPFGIWLPRNSYVQSRVGKIVNLEGLDSKEKIKIIKEQAIPFQTLLYKKGHILLYVGTYNNEIIVFHNIWGIKTKKGDKEGRIIIGKPIFSTLQLGKNQKYYDKNAEILKNLKSMNILTQKK